MSNVERNNELLSLTSEYGDRWMHDDVCTSEISNNENGEALVKLGVKSIKSVDQYGGEGQGEQYYNIFKYTFEDGEETFIKFEGWYASYCGSEYQEAYIVVPVEVMVTQYKQV